MGTLVAAVIKVDRMSAVQIGVSWNVRRLGVPNHAAVSCGEAKRVTVLTQAVDVRLLGKAGTPANILLLEDKFTSNRVEDDFIVLLARDFEREWAFNNVELKRSF